MQHQDSSIIDLLERKNDVKHKNQN